MASTAKRTKHDARPERAREDRLDAVFAALSSRTRRALLARLGRAPAYLTELAEPFDMTLPAISKHVRVLEDAGLLTREIDGRVHRCTFDPSPLRSVDDWLEHYRGFWDETLAALAKLAEAPRPTAGRRTRR